MAFSDKLTVVIDFVTGPAKSGLGGLRKEVAEAEGAFGKFKAGGSAAFDGLKQNIAGFAMGAAASIAGFAIKAVGEFQSLALAVGEFSEKTGVATEDASKWVELAADLNVPLGSIEGAFNKMNLAIAAGKPALESFDGAVVRTKTGAVDVDATFRNLVTQIGAIPDATKKAQAAQAIFGKSWGDISQLMGLSAEELKGKLDSVGEAKIIDPREVERARKFRDNVNDLKDRFEDLTITVGESLVPALDSAVEAVGPLIDGFQAANTAIKELTDNDLAGWASKLSKPFGMVGDSVNWFVEKITGTEDVVGRAWASFKMLVGASDETTASLDANTKAAGAMADMYAQRVAGATVTVGSSFDKAAKSALGLEIATGKVERAAQALDRAWGDLKGEIDADQAWIDMQTTFDDLRAKGEAAMEAAKTGAEDARAKMLDFESATNTAKQRIIDLGQEIGLTPTEVKTLLTMTDNGSIDAVEQRLATLTRNRTVNVDIVERGGAGYGDRRGGPRAIGGPVTAGTPYLVGERGPEVIVPGRGGTVIPNHRLGGGGGGVNVTINMPPGSNGADVVRAIQDYEKRNGKSWRS